MATEAEFEAANRSGSERESGNPRILHAKYDRRTHRIRLDLDTHVQLVFSPADVEGLDTASPEQLRKIQISPSGFAIHVPAVDADVYLPSLLKGFLGSGKWTASRQKAS